MYRLLIASFIWFLTILGVDALRSPAINSALTNRIGKVLPNDAAPLARQHYR